MTRRTAWRALLVGTGVAVAVCNPALGRDKRPPMRYASPAAIVAADVAMSQLAQRKGQEAALRASAAEGAVMFVPQPMIARDWFKSRPNLMQRAAWQAHQVWLSCDGSLAVSYGASSQLGGSPGYYTTVWQRQKKGDYKWVMTQGDTLAAELLAPEMIGAGVATCDRATHSLARPNPSEPAPAPVFPASARGGWSDDRTLSWAMTIQPDCGRALTVSLYRGAGKPLEPVLQKQVAGKPGAACPTS